MNQTEGCIVTILGDWAFGFSLGGYCGWVYYRFKAGRNVFKDKTRLMQNKIQRRILKKASGLGRVFGRWGGFYMLYRCLFGVFLSHNTAIESMVAGGLTSMTVAKIGKRVNMERRLREFRIGFFILAMIEIFLLVVIPINPPPLSTVEPMPGYWLERQKDAEEKLAQIQKLQRVAQRREETQRQ